MMDSLWSPHWQSLKIKTNAAERHVPGELYRQPLEDTVQPLHHNPSLQTEQGSGKRYRKVKSLTQKSHTGPPFQSRPVPLSTDSDGATSQHQERRNHEESTGPVHTFVKTDKHAHFKWGVRHHVGH